MKNTTFINEPAFKIAVVVISMAITAMTLNRYAQLIQQVITIKYNWQFELMIVTGMLFFQYPIIIKKNLALKLDYYFNMLLVSLIGSLLLWPLLFLNYYSVQTDLFNISYFFAVVLIMFFDHKRRVIRLKLPWLIFYTWILYRIIILFFIL